MARTAWSKASIQSSGFEVETMESMASEDKTKGNPTGFSGLSTLVSDVENSAPASKPVHEVVPPPSASANEGPPLEQAESAPIARALPKSSASTGNSSDVTTGKWMVGIGLAIGAFILLLNYSTRTEPVRSVSAPAEQQSAADAWRGAPPTSQRLTQDHSIGREAVAHGMAPTETVEVLGQRISFTNPTGYCTPGKSAREVELLDIARRSLGDSVRLVHAAVLCSELEDYRAGRRDMLDHWLQIQLLGPKGDFKRIEMAREAFLAGIAKSSPRVNSAEIDRRLQASFENSGLSISQTQMEPLGRDGNAVYFSMRMSMSVGDSSRPITGISGITLLNSLPLTINVYEGAGSSGSREKLQPVLQELLNSLLTEN